MITVHDSGSFKKTEAFLKRIDRKRRSRIVDSVLERYGIMGVDALSNATPIDTSETAKSWKYKITNEPHETTIEWYNTNVVDGRPIAVLIQYGHATGTGGYVQGRDYINPAIQPIFDKIMDDIWKQVTR